MDRLAAWRGRGGFLCFFSCGSSEETGGGRREEAAYLVETVLKLGKSVCHICPSVCNQGVGKRPCLRWHEVDGAAVMRNGELRIVWHGGPIQRTEYLSNRSPPHLSLQKNFNKYCFIWLNLRHNSPIQWINSTILLYSWTVNGEQKVLSIESCRYNIHICVDRAAGLTKTNHPHLFNSSYPTWLVHHLYSTPSNWIGRLIHRSLWLVVCAPACV